MRVRGKLAILVAAGALASAILGLLELGIPGRTSEDSTSLEIVESRAPSPPKLEPIASAPSNARSVVPRGEARASRGRVEAPSAARLGAGRVQIRALDSETRLGLESFRVRAGTSARIADRSSNPATGEVELTLSTGTYSVLVLCPGYEPTELESVEVHDRGSIDLGWVPLRRGRGRVQGRVSGELPAEPAVFVELRGGSRRPCARCTSPYERFCPQCGYATRASRLPIQDDGRFAFEGLGSGPCVVALTDEEDRIYVPPVHFDVRPDEVVAIALEFPGVRDLCLEVIDTDGTSLAREWAARRRRELDAEEEQGSVVYDASLPEFSGTIRAEAFDVATMRWAPPAREEGTVRVFSSRAFGCGVSRRSSGGAVDDRARDPTEPLRPRMDPPVLVPPKLFLDVGSDGLVHLDRMPASALTVELACGPFDATAAVPRSVGPERVRVELACRAHTVASSVPERSTFRGFEASRDRSD